MLEINSTISKRNLEYENAGPKEIDKGCGAYLYSTKGSVFLDCGMALGSVFIGYADDRVNSKAIEAIHKGVNFSRPSVLERTFFEKLSEIFEKDIVGKLSKSSSMLLNTLPRICRALTGKKYLLIQSEGAFLGNVDWYHSVNQKKAGTHENFVLTFKHGNRDEVIKVFSSHGANICGLIVEPYRHKQYNLEYYYTLRRLCDRYGCLLIFDETLSAFRFYKRTFELESGIAADLTILGKAISNGFPLACVVGKKELFTEIDNNDKLFGFSNTHAGEAISIAASMETIRILNYEANYKVFYGHNLNFIASLNALLQYYKSKLYVVGNTSYFWLQGEQKQKSQLVRFCCEKGVLFRGTFAFSLAHTHKDREYILDTIEEYYSRVKHG
ncbi:aminotransferase class III-fold pyridoxal phosphate-dependent enzyme [Martelella alba]|uniref:Aminotransferase class III-fold pyridoxal phosphate-dependent enzyme n=1 Tax=Martelella alba TaxID=2590451 RepID=A0ABY2SG87_9HYPH|nr:aminotransferase class III-fold pyridoxal phosphate-dependent enzyme [Martelella alba]TKI04115.1 aminotransferase class III-fold pyridoxal phosphate-dependent enzyme [Martelella alba]